MAGQWAKHADVLVITRLNNRGAIEESLKPAPVPGLELVYYDLPAWVRRLKKGEAGVQTYYYLWQLGAFLLAKRLHRERRFNLVHHITFGKYWGPSLMHRLGIPLVLGPLGGGDETPRSFRRYLSPKARFYESVRNTVRCLAEWDPMVRGAAKMSKVALATTEATRSRLKRMGAKRVVLFPQAGLSKEDLAILNGMGLPDSGPVRFISLGRLIGWKGHELGLRAFAQMKERSAEYWMVGDGPERARLEKLGLELGVATRIKFWGSLLRSEAFRRLGECHVLVHPSLHDSSPWACVEAQASGRPVICLGLGGPDILVTDETGVRIDPSAPEQVIKEMANAMDRLAKDRDRLIAMGEAGRGYARERFLWEAKQRNLMRLLEPEIPFHSYSSVAAG